MTSIHLLLLAGVAYAFHPSADQQSVLIVAAVLTVPFNLLMFATENLIFLISPEPPGERRARRLLDPRPADLHAIPPRRSGHDRRRHRRHRRPPGVPGHGAVLAGALAAVTAAVLLVESAAMIPALAWAFARFDPSLHTPGQ